MKHTHAHTYIYPCIHTYVHTYIHTYIHTFIHTFIHTYKVALEDEAEAAEAAALMADEEEGLVSRVRTLRERPPVQVYVCARVRNIACMQVSVCMRVSAYTNTHTHTHTRTHTLTH